ncbi:P44/Msp2 family outer membrane protein [Ehrlichia ruminantium]|uniref:MAP1-3 n=2 Tax=Ehrlichia ruminantium TaxID=779 RepID=Q6VCX9_EHRRU|nr:P44/Msp2 family outer membrane protein [Ehrlichia ruminantium]BBG58256.1 map1-3 [uncultured Ehrlichia sp.]AAR10942.1 MAP1-3 [Ehrlichia ruminantium]KYW93865.1 P44/Msp2 family outer membrane protein [Ehrlichia ruminantium]QLK55557.1 P44/Msp2 family outer membrane protein [Ehrlichia ruminantium]QLK56473.1 P44/Msp2 family outer membrane protein [Ehrlichia ruminantium]
MTNKLTFTGTVLALLLCIPNTSFSEIKYNNNTHIQYSIYVSGQYKPSVSNFRNFSVKETNTYTKNLIGVKKDITSLEVHTNNNKPIVSRRNPNPGPTIKATGISHPSNFNIPYNPEFQDNIINFSGTIGYQFSKSKRIEIEGSYKIFDVKDPGGYMLYDAYRYFALAREMNDTKFEPKPYQLDNVFNNFYHTVMKNTGLSIISVMINGCHDFHVNELKISPYICAGVGINTIEFFDTSHIKFAYQGKIGISYPLSNNIKVFSNGYYHKVAGNKFKNLEVIHVANLHNAPWYTSAIATLNIGYFGAEVGIRLGLKL